MTTKEHDSKIKRVIISEQEIQEAIKKVGVDIAVSHKWEPLGKIPNGMRSKHFVCYLYQSYAKNQKEAIKKVGVDIAVSHKWELLGKIY